MLTLSIGKSKLIVKFPYSVNSLIIAVKVWPISIVYPSISKKGVSGT